MIADGRTKLEEATLPEGYRAERMISMHENRIVIRTETPDGGSTVLKMLLPPYDDADALDFRDEFLLLDALAHPYWVRPRLFGSTPAGALFIEMEDVPGLPLSVHSLRGWAPETLEAARRILSGLVALHHLGTAHLDLKPGQILLDAPLQVSEWESAGLAEVASRVGLRMLDLGLAAPFRTPLKARGTPGFMAPELLRGETDWNARADIYALGAVLFDLFTGHPAFEAEDAAAILALQLSGAIPDPGAAGDLPPLICSLLREMLSPDPEDRPATALDVWHRLREQIPRDRVRELPARLTGPDTFAFTDREDEVARFERFIGEHGDSAEPLLVLVTGEIGVGRRRLAGRLRALAQASGWIPGVSGDGRHLLRREGAAGGTLAIAVSEGTALETPCEEPCAGGPCLALRLERMSSGLCEAMLQTLGVESPMLRRSLAECSLGNPGLLCAAANRMPPELDLLVPLVGVDLLHRHLDESPPPYWLSWYADLLGRVGRVEGDELLKAALLERTDAEGGRPCTAILGADPERTRRIGGDLLRSDLAQSSAAEQARLASILRAGDVLELVLAPALEELLSSGNHEEAMRLFSRACSVLDPSSAGWTRESLLKLAESAPLLGVRHGSLLPSSEQLQVLAGNPKLPAAVLLRAWSAMARNEWEVADSCLAETGAQECSPFVSGWLRFRRSLLSRELPAARSLLETLSEHSAEHPAAGFIIQSGWAEVQRHEGRLDEAAATLEALLGQAPAIPGALHFASVHRAANLALNRGDLDVARALLHEALELADRNRLVLSRPTVLMGLAGLDYQAGNLPGSLEWCEGLLREWTREQRWDQAVTAISNAGLLLLEQGRIGESMRLLLRGRALASEAGNHLSRIRIGRRMAQGFAWMGLHDRAEDIAGRLLEEDRLAQPERGHILCILGLTMMDAGRLDEGRESYAGGVQCLCEAGAREDAADALGFWALSELDTGNVGSAGRLRGEAEELMSVVSGVTGSIRLLVDGRLAVQAGEAPERSREILDQAVSALRDQNRWFFAWQAHWFRARAMVWMNEPAAAAGEYGEARRIVSAMLGSLSDQATAGRFLDRPILRQFLDELEMV